MTVPQYLNLRVAPRTVQQEVVDKLRQAIFSEHFPPGSRLIEGQLCQQLGVSRPSLREALRSLQAERLIEIVPNRGPIVPTLSWEEAVAIYEVREMIEVEAAGRCAVRMSRDGLSDLRAALAQFEAAVSGSERFTLVRTAADFYAVMLAHCGNPVLEEVHRGLLARVSFLRGRSMSLDGRALNSLTEMSAIVEAIAAGDEKSARKAARRHLAMAQAAAKTAIEARSQ